MTEEEFVNSLITSTRARRCLCDLLGWQTAHFRPAMVQSDKTGRKTWRTACQGDAAGFVDLVLARPPRLVLAECKTDAGRLTPEQTQWLDVLSECHREVYLFRPKWMHEVIEILSLGHEPNAIELNGWQCTWTGKEKVSVGRRVDGQAAMEKP